MTFAAFLRGAQEISFGSSTSLSFASGRYVLATATTTSLDLKMPVATGHQMGEGVCVIVNDGANSFDVADKDGVTIQTLAAGKAAYVGLYDNSTAAGSWAAVLLDDA